MNWRLLYFFILIGWLSKSGLAQDSLVYNYSYKIIDAQKFENIPYAHIYNESRRYGAIADSLGDFTIKANEGDTLVLLALGYLGMYYQVYSEDTTERRVLKLFPRTYNIDEVTVSAPKSYESFQHDFLTVNPEEGEIMPQLPEHNKYKTPLLLDTNVTHTLGFMVFHPVSGLYYRFSKVEKSKRKVWYAQQQELRQQEVDEKFNRSIVSEITGYKDDELTQFIGFCNFSFNYLLNASPLDIIIAIEEKNEQYLKCCHDKNNFNTNTE